MSDETNEHTTNCNIRKQKVGGVEWTYIVKDGFVVIGDGSSTAIPKSTSGKIASPATLGGCPVAKIGNKAFACCDKLTSVKIPEGVKCIGDRAFLCCESIAKVTIPKGVVSIEPFAFSHCKALTCLTIPESVTSIGNNAFWLCGKLESVRIPGNVVSIGLEAFVAERIAVK